MRVMLKENIEALGKKGEIHNVAPGYGRNYLIPKNLAIEVTSSNIKMIKIEQKSLQKGLEKEMASYKALAEKLNQVSLTFTRKTGEKDVLFGSVSAADIREALEEQGFDIEKKRVLLEEPIKRLGNYTVPIKVFHEERAEIKVAVVSEEEKEEKTAEIKAIDEEKAKAEKEPETEKEPITEDEQKTNKGLEAEKEPAKDEEPTAEKEVEMGEEPEVVDKEESSGEEEKKAENDGEEKKEDLGKENSS